MLGFSTEGSSLLNIRLSFSDGTTFTALTNYNLGDWFDNTTNVVLSGFGRCSRTTPAGAENGFPSNPRMYFIDIPLSCANAQKNLASINVANVTTSGNALFPNAVIMAVSGVANPTLTVTPTVTNATCTSLGSATLNLTGGVPAFTVSWNTLPLQNGLTATNLSAGNYIATITDGNSCVTTSNISITQTNNLTMTQRLDTAICSGASFFPNIVSNATGYTWSPNVGVSNAGILNPSLSPTVTTPYILSGTLGTCSISRSFTVFVNTVTFNQRLDTTICSGASFSPNIVSNATGYTWSPTTGVSNSGIANPILSPIVTTPYAITGSLGLCSAIKNFTVFVNQGVSVNAGNDASIFAGESIQLQGSGTVGTYIWTPSLGLSATNVLNPIASPLTTTIYTLRITTAQGCTNTSSVQVQVSPYCLRPLVAFTPNGDGINDKWVISNGNCLLKAQVNVYNRYGSSVYENSNYQNEWEGSYKGKPLPDGTYYYKIEYILLNGRKVYAKGDVTILR
ncbi:MAG: gliding motility-associated C-terminal domain-containing protein [Ferruginibacter sp.]